MLRPEQVMLAQTDHDTCTYTVVVLVRLNQVR